MGYSKEYVCNECGEFFRSDHGGGFVYHLLHCDRCGKERAVPFRSLGELHYKFLKGLENGYCCATEAYDKHIKQTYPGEVISEEEYQHEIEEMFTGKCDCGGSFIFDAPVRCPECMSTNLEEDPDGNGEMSYD